MRENSGIRACKIQKQPTIMRLNSGKVLELRNLAKMSRAQAAQAAGINEDTWEAIEKGKRKDGTSTQVNENTLAAVARVLRVKSSDELLLGADEPQNTFKPSLAPPETLS